VARTKLQGLLQADGVKTEDKDAMRTYLQGKPEAAFYHNKVQAAIHFAYRVLPQVAARAVAIRAGEMGPIEAIL
jgi:hypothetical protein